MEPNSPIWWTDSTVIGWISIILILVFTPITLYFTSEKFASMVRRNVILLKLFFTESFRAILLVVSALVATYFLLIGNTLVPLIVFIAGMAVTTISAVKEKKGVSNIVWCELGNLKSEDGAFGLKYLPYRDGNAKRKLLDQQYIRQTEIAKKQGYMYFKIDGNRVNDFRQHKGRNTYIIVEYFDDKAYGDFSLHYDSTDKEHFRPEFKGALENTEFTGTNTWKTAIWNLSDANFQGRQQQEIRADFRLQAGKASSSVSPTGKFEAFDVSIRKVVVVSVT